EPSQDGPSALQLDGSVQDATCRYVTDRVLDHECPESERNTYGEHKALAGPLWPSSRLAERPHCGLVLVDRRGGSFAAARSSREPGPPAALGEPQTAKFDGQSHCGIVVGIGASDEGSGSGDTDCVSVEAGRDTQVNTRGFGDIGMQFQQSPVKAPITNVHNSN